MVTGFTDNSPGINNDNANGTSHSITFPSDVSEGDPIVITVCLSGPATTISSVDSGLTQEDRIGTPNNGQIYVFHGVYSSTMDTTFTTSNTKECLTACYAIPKGDLSNLVLNDVFDINNAVYIVPISAPTSDSELVSTNKNFLNLDATLDDTIHTSACVLSGYEEIGDTDAFIVTWTDGTPDGANSIVVGVPLKRVLVSVALQWSVKSIITLTPKFVWNVKVSIILTPNFKWSILKQIITTPNFKWKIFKQVVLTPNFVWNVKKLITSTPNFIWSVGGTLIKTAKFIWGVRTTTTKTLNFKWSTKETITKEPNFKWSVKSIITLTPNFAWNVLSIILVTPKFIWSTGGRIVKTFTAKWKTKSFLTWTEMSKPTTIYVNVDTSSTSYTEIDKPDSEWSSL